MEQDNRPLVTVICTSYNHEKFIKECLDGFVIQQTNFPFEVIVHDDASTDNTQQIVKEYESEYPYIFNNIYQIENQFSKKEFDIWCDIMFPKAKGKYIAICDGDDYWTDPLKLQKQVDFLEANPDYGLVHTDCLLLQNSSGELCDNRKRKVVKKSKFAALLTGDYNIYTLTTCFRRGLYLSYVDEIQPIEKKWLMGDLCLWLYISKFSKIHLLDEVTSVYRVLEESASNTKSIEKAQAFASSIMDVKRYFIDRYEDGNSVILKDIETLSTYNQLVINIASDHSSKSFFEKLFYFHTINRSPRLFFGSFKQVLKKMLSFFK
jgi:glycosyltransferase involved in cell wall biosynthesis